MSPPTGAIKIVSIIDEHSCECLGGMVERSITGERLNAELDRAAAERGSYPAVLRCDDEPNWPAAQWPTGRPGMSACTSSRLANRGAADRRCRRRLVARSAHEIWRTATLSPLRKAAGISVFG
jgi:hypothetical protein